MVTEKNEIQARIDELKILAANNYPLDQDIQFYIEQRTRQLEAQLRDAPDHV